MDNLTILNKIIKPHEGLDPLQGYAIVVYEQMGTAGEVFRGVIKPGGKPFQKPKTGLKNLLGLKEAQTYIAIAVNCAPELRFTFNEHFIHDNQVNEFDVRFDLLYYVADPETIATGRNHDPLRQFRDEIIRIIGRSLRQVPWEEVRTNFRNLEQPVVSKASSEMENFATKIGFAFNRIELHLRLPETTIRPDKVKESSNLEVREHEITQEAIRKKRHEIDLTEDQVRQVEQRRREQDKENAAKLREMELNIKLGHISKEDQIHLIEQRQKFREGVTEGSISAIKGVGGNISTPAELQDAIHVAQPYLSPGFPVSESRSGNVPFMQNQIQGAGGIGMLPAEGQRWIQSLMTTLTEVSGWGYPFEKQRSLTSAMLHLVAELLLDDRADDQILQRYASQISELSRQLDPPLTAKQSQLLKEFEHYQRLREQFK